MTVTLKNTLNVIIFLLTLALFTYIYKSGVLNALNKQEEEYECQAVFRLTTPELSFPIVAGVKVKNNRGVISFGGPVYKNNIFTGMVNRRVEFDYRSDFTASQFKVTKIVKFEKDNLDDKIAEHIIPGFFSTMGATIYFNSKKVKDGILFFRDNAPMFYCRYE